MMDELEQLVDQIGLCGVISLLADVCNEKAEHLRSNWQDKKAAQSWEADTRRLDRTYKKLDN